MACVYHGLSWESLPLLEATLDTEAIVMEMLLARQMSRIACRGGRQDASPPVSLYSD